MNLIIVEVFRRFGVRKGKFYLFVFGFCEEYINVMIVGYFDMDGIFFIFNDRKGLNFRGILILKRGDVFRMFSVYFY